MRPQTLTAVALVLAASQAHAAVIPVTKACTLLRAISAANNDTTATGHCRKGVGPDTIVLPHSSVQVLTAVNTIAVQPGTDLRYPVGLPVIRTRIAISGNGSTIQRVKSAPILIFSM